MNLPTQDNTPYRRSTSFCKQNQVDSVLKEHFPAEERLEWALGEMREGLWCYKNIQGSSLGRRRRPDLREVEEELRPDIHL